jgi:hypothetical protein
MGISLGRVIRDKSLAESIGWWTLSHHTPTHTQTLETEATICFCSGIKRHPGGVGWILHCVRAFNHLKRKEKEKKIQK